jgi:hypothetical protein
MKTVAVMVTTTGPDDLLNFFILSFFLSSISDCFINDLIHDFVFNVVAFLLITMYCFLSAPLYCYSFIFAKAFILSHIGSGKKD